MAEIEPVVISKAFWFDAVATGKDIDVVHLQAFAKSLDPPSRIRNNC